MCLFALKLIHSLTLFLSLLVNHLLIYLLHIYTHKHIYMYIDSTMDFVVKVLNKYVFNIKIFT